MEENVLPGQQGPEGPTAPRKGEVRRCEAQIHHNIFPWVIGLFLSGGQQTENPEQAATQRLKSWAEFKRELSGLGGLKK